MLVSLVLAVVLQPVMASMAELHELGHGAEHAHVDGGDLSTSEAADEDGGTPDPLHAVHHIAHCCGQTAVPSSTAQLRLMLLPAMKPAFTLAVPHARSHPHLPFRPPITQ